MVPTTEQMAYRMRLAGKPNQLIPKYIPWDTKHSPTRVNPASTG